MLKEELKIVPEVIGIWYFFLCFVKQFVASANRLGKRIVFNFSVNIAVLYPDPYLSNFAINNILNLTFGKPVNLYKRVSLQTFCAKFDDFPVFTLQKNGMTDVSFEEIGLDSVVVSSAERMTCARHVDKVHTDGRKVGKFVFSSESFDT